MTAIIFTRTTGNEGVMTVDLELELYAGSPITDTAWLNGGDSAGYPGNLDGFQAKNTNTSDATEGLKLVVGTCTLVQNNNVFTIGGGGSIVHAIVIGGSGVAATSCSVDAGLGTGAITFACEGNLTGSTGFMAIVS